MKADLPLSILAVQQERERFGALFLESRCAADRYRSAGAKPWNIGCEEALSALSASNRR
jgi:hypothetical protein